MARKKLNKTAAATKAFWAAVRSGKRELPAKGSRKPSKPRKPSKGTKPPPKAKKRAKLTEAPSTAKEAKELLRAAREKDQAKAKKLLKRAANKLAIEKRGKALKLFEKHRGGGEAAERAAANISLAKLYQVEDEIKARKKRNAARLDYYVDAKGKAHGKDGRFTAMPKLAQFLGTDRYQRRVSFIQETLTTTYPIAREVDSLLREEWEGLDEMELEYELAGDEYED